jgi:hypothetical protein
MPKYNWVAIYPDPADNRREVGFPMYKPDGTRNRYEDIDRKNLMRFEMHDSEQTGNPIVLSLYFSKGQELIWDTFIWRMRVEKRTGGGQDECRVHVVGWQKRVMGKNVQFVFVMSEATGKIVASDGWRKDDPWLYPVVQRDVEKPTKEG